MRLDSYVAEYFPEHSRSAWQKYIAAGQVLVNGEVITVSKYLLGEDDVVTVQEKPPQKKAADLPMLYEDDNVLVIDKPAGVLTHAKGGIVAESTVADFVKPFTTYKADTNRPGIIHRLDRDTSGVIITVKNDETASLLQKQFTERKVKKIYHAIVKGNLKYQEAEIDLPIERNPKTPSQFRVGASGKSAKTHYKVLKSRGELHLVELRPETGRTHQLRVHMAYLGAPIVGDKVYGGVKADRMYLHAHSLEITIPKSQRKVFSSPVPESFQHFLKVSHT